jgi:hypothetical protein
MDVEHASVQIGDAAQKFFEVRSAVLVSQPFVEKAEQKIAVKRVELILAVFRNRPVESVTKVVRVPVQKSLTLNEIHEHQAVEHDRCIPLLVGLVLDAIDELEKRFALRIELPVKPFRNSVDVEGGPDSPRDSCHGQTGFLFLQGHVEQLEFLEQGIPGLASCVFVCTYTERSARFAADPHP